jgi:U3 small nucleolar ribonucleoprotein protein IMP4
VTLLTTSRRPTPRIRTFCRDLARSIPNVVRINRGKLSLDGIAEKTLELNANQVIIVDRWKGGPGKIEFFKIGQEGLVSFPPIMYVSSIKLQRELDKVKAKPVRSLIITTSSEKSDEIIRIARSLSNFLNVPLSQMDKAVSKSKTSMHILTDDLHRTQVTFMLFIPENVEIGPRITLSHVAWEIKK